MVFNPKVMLGMPFRLECTPSDDISGIIYIILETIETPPQFMQSHAVGTPPSDAADQDIH